jgi:serine-type D-Ala-D-Ala carboxypeptidase/endopeptidase (penicillin-binding protein 4)
MKRYLLVTLTLLWLAPAMAQPVKQRLENQANAFRADSQMKHGILGLYVADAVTGEVVYEWNSQTGLAPASTQKIITSVAAFDLLGKGYQYKTALGYNGKLGNGQLKGDLYVVGSGDPTLGSWRYGSAKSANVFQQFSSEMIKSGISKITGNVYLDASKFSYQPIPGGWIWDDIGNYYGAGTWGLNWRENQYELIMNPGAKEGDAVEILGTEPKQENFSLMNHLRTGKKGSGDNAYIYFPPYSTNGFVEGTVPAGEPGFKISGSFPNAPQQFGYEFRQLLGENNIHLDGSVVTLYDPPATMEVFYEYASPTLDSIIYWFMKKSINLYGETLMKTIGAEKAGSGTVDSGIAVVRRFYNEKGISPAEIRIQDGSGLSPSNRITAHALGEILLYAKKQSWFPEFSTSFPQYNNMKLKSGTIRGVKGFAGYHTSKEGKEYVVAMIVNNYDGSAASITNKMFKVLDELK